MSRSRARNGTHLRMKPGVCGPSGPILRNSLAVPCFDQSVRISTQACAGMRPCLRLPLLDDRLGQQEVGVRRRLLRNIDDAGRADEPVHRDVVGGVVRVVLAGHPVDRRIEVRAGVLAAGDVVPVPGRAARVVARDLLERERLGGRELRRQLDGGSRRLQRHGQIDDADAAADDAADQLGKCCGDSRGSLCGHDPLRARGAKIIDTSSISAI